MDITGIGGSFGGFPIPAQFGGLSAGQKLDRLMETKDANADGVLSADEFGIPEDKFAEIDTDGNGSLTREELEEAAKIRLAQMQNQLKEVGGQQLLTNLIESKDTNADGALSIEEFGIPEDKFAEIDKDGDGLVTEEELKEAGHKSRAQNHFHLGGMDLYQMLAKMIENKDSDEDGALSSDEFGIPEDIFAEIDEDADGLVTQEELAAAVTDFGSLISKRFDIWA